MRCLCGYRKVSVQVIKKKEEVLDLDSNFILELICLSGYRKVSVQVIQKEKKY